MSKRIEEKIEEILENPQVVSESQSDVYRALYELARYMDMLGESLDRHSHLDSSSPSKE